MKIRCCGDCAVEEGELHEEGCDQEICGICGAQVLAWGKCKGAKPELYFASPFFCQRCGVIMPDLFVVSDEDWKFVCGTTYPLKCVLCKKCFEFIKSKRRKKNASCK